MSTATVNATLDAAADDVLAAPISTRARGRPSRGAGRLRGLLLRGSRQLHRPVRQPDGRRSGRERDHRLPVRAQTLPGGRAGRPHSRGRRVRRREHARLGPGVHPPRRQRLPAPVPRGDGGGHPPGLRMVGRADPVAPARTPRPPGGRVVPLPRVGAQRHEPKPAGRSARSSWPGSARPGPSWSTGRPPRRSRGAGCPNAPAGSRRRRSSSPAAVPGLNPKRCGRFTASINADPFIREIHTL